MPKKISLHNVYGRQPGGRLRERLNDALSGEMKSLNLSNKEANNRAEWGELSEPKRSCKIKAYFM